jgi:hypothetical protein
MPWSAPVVRALGQFMYTGRLVLPTALLADVYQAAQEAALRPLVYCLRTYAYYGLRLTSAETASHIQRFALVAGSRKIASLAAAYHTHLSAHDRNYTLIAPVPLAWLRARPFLLDAGGSGSAIVLAFNRRPQPVHETSPNLVVSLKDAVGREPFEEPCERGEEGEGEGKGEGAYRNGCLHLPTAAPMAGRCVGGLVGLWWVVWWW